MTSELPKVCGEDCTCVSDLLAGWRDLGHMADALLASADLSEDERAGIEQMRHGAMHFIRSLDEGPP